MRRGRILKPLITGIVDFLTDIYGLHRFSKNIKGGHSGILLRKQRGFSQKNVDDSVNDMMWELLEELIVGGVLIPGRRYEKFVLRFLRGIWIDDGLFL